MKRFFSIGQKLSASFGVLVGITLLIVGLNYVAGINATRKIDATEELRAPILLAATQAQAGLLKAQVHIRSYLLWGNADDAVQYGVARLAFEENFKVLRRLLAKQAMGIDAQRIAELDALYLEWAPLAPA